MKKYYYKVTNINSCSIYSKGKYNLHYTKGKTVEAVSGSLGIMVFDSMSNVHSFLKYQILTDSKLKESIHQRVLVYKVIGIGKGYIPKQISYYQNEDELNKYYTNTPQYMSPPTGNICFQKVRVIDLVENDIRKCYYKVIDRAKESLYTYKKYSLKYPTERGSIIEAVPGTLGIMVFDSFRNVKNFMERNGMKIKDTSYRTFTRKVLVYKVIGIGKMIIPKYVCSSSLCVSYMNEFYSKPNKWHTTPDEGTVCFPKIEMIEPETWLR